MISDVTLHTLNHMYDSMSLKKPCASPCQNLDFISLTVQLNLKTQFQYLIEKQEIILGQLLSEY